MKSPVVALLSTVSPVLAAATSTSNALWPRQTFVSEPSLHPPVLDVNKTGATAPGYLFFAQNARRDDIQQALLIMTDEGELVYQANGDVSDMMPTRLFGRPVFSYWERTGAEYNILGLSYGNALVRDDAYNLLYNVTLKDPTLVAQSGFNPVSFIDDHETYITKSNTLLVPAFNITPWDLSPIGGPKDGWLRDSVVYELDIKTGAILFRWRASDAVDITATKVALSDSAGSGQNSSTAFDFFHLNSIQDFEGGYVVSGRHTFDAIYISGRTGATIWRLQGEDGGDFTLDPAGQFRWQHDVRLHRGTGGQLLLSVHNNDNNFAAPFSATTGNVLTLDTQRMTAGVHGIYQNPQQTVYSNSGGNVQLLAHGHVFVGQGSQPVHQEYDSDGAIVYSAWFGPDDSKTTPGVTSYRSFRSTWHGYPKTKPAAKACATQSNGVTVYMSWNGATEVVSWRVYAAGGGRWRRQLLAEVPKSGFETSASVPAGVDSVQVVAVSRSRHGGIETTMSETVMVETC